jgi:hypothetical protein
VLWGVTEVDIYEVLHDILAAPADFHSVGFDIKSTPNFTSIPELGYEGQSNLAKKMNIDFINKCLRNAKKNRKTI